MAWQGVRDKSGNGWLLGEAVRVLSPLLAPGSPHRRSRSCLLPRGGEPPIDSGGPLFQGSVLDQFAGWWVLRILSALSSGLAVASPQG